MCRGPSLKLRWQTRLGQHKRAIFDSHIEIDVQLGHGLSYALARTTTLKGNASGSCQLFFSCQLHSASARACCPCSCGRLPRLPVNQSTASIPCGDDARNALAAWWREGNRDGNTPAQHWRRLRRPTAPKRIAQPLPAHASADEITGAFAREHSLPTRRCRGVGKPTPRPKPCMCKWGGELTEDS